MFKYNLHHCVHVERHLPGANPGFSNRGGANDYVHGNAHPAQEAHSPLRPGSRAQSRAWKLVALSRYALF